MPRGAEECGAQPIARPIAARHIAKAIVHALRYYASNEFTAARCHYEGPGTKRRRQTARSMGGSCEGDWVLTTTAKVLR